MLNVAQLWASLTGTAKIAESEAVAIVGNVSAIQSRVVALESLLPEVLAWIAEGKSLETKIEAALASRPAASVPPVPKTN